jgi:protein-L-isoaspartate(D-aspartate) O-methyltransferase
MTVHAPAPDFAAARQAMVDSQLRPQGVNDPSVISAMSLVPRELFVPESERLLAYADRAIPLGEGRALPAPEVLGLLLTAMAPDRGQSALVVGGATGYSAAVLKEMGIRAISLESSPALAAVARERGLEIAEGPLDSGLKRGAPYDLILIDGAVEFVPDALVAQLKEGGRLGAALVEQGVSRLIVGRKAGGGFGFHSIADAATPALPGFERPKAFTF